MSYLPNNHHDLYNYNNKSYNYPTSYYNESSKYESPKTNFIINNYDLLQTNQDHQYDINHLNNYNNLDKAKSLSNIDNNIDNRYSSQYKDDYKDKINSFNKNDNSKLTNICGIKNYGNNCYLNSGLQILASSENFVTELKKYHCNKNMTNLINQAIYELLNNQVYDPLYFLNYFTKINNEFSGVQSCSQNFIRTLLKNLNDELLSTNDNLIVENQNYNPTDNKEYTKYYSFISHNRIYPESSLLNLFSGISKSHSKNLCIYCKELINEYSFSYFIDQNLYLDEIKTDSCKFSEVLKKNFEKSNLTMNCPRCSKEISLEEETTIVKLPDVFIFTLERYQGENNNTSIEPDPIIDIREYVDINLNDRNTRYELFAINIRFGKSKNFGHEICQVKRKGNWYEINDLIYNVRTNSYNRNSYGLFYRRIKY